MKICIVLSTRPEIIKLAPLIEAFTKKKINFFLVNTNQHYSKNMSKVFFDFFKIKYPKYNINANSSKEGDFFAKAVSGVERILYKEKPNFLIIQGDTNTALAGCFAASVYNRRQDKKINIVHVEAGLRSFDNNMPEEINRKLIDQMSNTLFVPTKFDLENLKSEDIMLDKKIFITGNTISDIVKNYLPLIKKNNILEMFQIFKKEYFLLTLHRPESVDDASKFKKLILNINKIGKKFNIQFLFPVHPRTEKIIKKIEVKQFKNIIFSKPLNFLDFLTIMNNSKIIFTDSGGIQEESSLLGVPCITLRNSTERQLSVIKKCNILTGYDYKKIFKAVMYFNKNKIKAQKIFGDGKVSDRILNTLKKIKKS